MCHNIQYVQHRKVRTLWLSYLLFYCDKSFALREPVPALFSVTTFAVKNAHLVLVANFLPTIKTSLAFQFRSPNKITRHPHKTVGRWQKFTGKFFMGGTHLLTPQVQFFFQMWGYLKGYTLFNNMRRIDSKKWYKTGKIIYHKFTHFMKRILMTTFSILRNKHRKCRSLSSPQQEQLYIPPLLPLLAPAGRQRFTLVCWWSPKMIVTTSTDSFPSSEDGLNNAALDGQSLEYHFTT